MKVIYRLIFSLIITTIIVVSCESPKTKNFTLNGQIKGLKKGMVYLQKDGDSSIVTIDSVMVDGQSDFTLQTDLEEPILLYLNLDKKDGKDYFIPFFADSGLVEIKTSLKHFSADAKITGSKQQDLLETYLDILSQYNNQNLELIEANFNAQKANDSILVDSLNKKSAALVKRKYSYTIQYALNNPDSEIAPYLALYEIRNANPVFIDSIYRSLTPAIKSSYYGKKLHDLIKNRDSIK